MNQNKLQQNILYIYPDQTVILLRYTLLYIIYNLILFSKLHVIARYNIILYYILIYKF